MRLKLILIFSTIVVIVTAVLFAASSVVSRKETNSSQASRALQAAMVQLSVEGLVMERWLAAKVNDPTVREPFAAGTPNARGEQATTVVNRIKDAAASTLAGIEVSLVMLVDAQGLVLGRNNSTLMRGQNVASAYPSLKMALEGGSPGSDVWVDRTRNEQLLASFVPVRGDDGKVIGALVVGSSLNDERMSRASDRTSGEALAFLVKGPAGVELVAKSSKTDADRFSSLTKSPAAEAVGRTLTTGEALDVPGFPEGYLVKSRPLEGYGDGKRAALVAIVAPQKLESGALVFASLGTAVLGILLVIVAAVLFDAYLSKPISEMEDALLAIMNGQTNRRVEVEHAELGGLAFRLNSLLNQLFGVAEDDTDAEGRPSAAPSAREFKEALAADESIVLSGATSESAVLRAEADDVYYSRVFREYVEAKRSAGDPTDHITQDEFIGRIMASERELGQKHGKPVRFKVELKGREVVLKAIPLV